MGDAEESADLIEYYALQVEETDGFTRPMAKMTPVEKNTEMLRPYGVFVCIAPFNFPLALSPVCHRRPCWPGECGGVQAGRGHAGPDSSCTRSIDAGVPAGVFNYVSGHGREIGDPLWQHPLTDGVVFTGSKEVGMRIHHGISQKWVKPCLMELGGKNAVIVMDSADLDAAAEGVMKSAFGLQNQKCSATSRVYVHRAVAQPFIAKLLERTKAMVMGDVSQKDVYFGPVINGKAVNRWQGAVDQAREEGKILTGGERLKGEVFDKGHFVAPTIAALPLKSSLFFEELFVPFLAVGEVASLDEALAEANKAEYGLTAGFFSQKKEEIDRFFDEIEAGVCYVNKRTGATRRLAWCAGILRMESPARGKGGCGPWYVRQFAREQSRTVIEG
jgi:1-pyrroline-5-carboxylate dehydrogenase